MVKALQRSFLFRFLALSVLAVILGTVSATGQISIKSDQTHQISFVTGETVINDRSARVSLSDISRITSFSYNTDLADISTRTSDNFYVTGASDELSVGKLSSSELPGELFFPVSYVNQTGKSIGEIQLSFDFIYNFFSFDEDYTLALKYRVNDGELRNAESGIIQFNMLSSNRDEWSSFSIQLSINDLYLRPDDRVDFIWFIEDFESGEETGLPIALNRIESQSSFHTPEELEPGSLIISELLPPFMYQDELTEYIEIYNPSDFPVSAKGLEIQTSIGEFVIQKDLSIEPFEVIVLGNSSISEDHLLNTDIQFDESLLSSSGGRIELIQDGRSISLVTYEAAEQGVSLELNNAVNAYDGYTSLSNFTASVNQVDENLNGSPGSLGNTIPMFRHAIETDGWIFYSPPGRFINQLNRNQSLFYFDNVMNARPSGEIEPFTPVLMFKERNEKSYLHVEQIAKSEISQRPLQVGNSSKMIQTPTHQTVSLNKIADETGNRISPAALIWNHQKNKFELIREGTDFIEGWQPFIVNESVSEQIQVLDNDRIAGTPDLTKFINLSLHETENGRATDQAVIGFIDQSNAQQNRKYSLPKLLTDFDKNNDLIEPDYSFLYLTSQMSDESTNSFLHLPGTIDSSYELRLGHYLTTEGTRASFSWEISKEVPEEWIIELIDTQSGDVIDMREENSYSFISGDNEDDFQKDGDSPITALQSDGDERFLISLKPYESVVEEETDDTPESVELRQNYPNPFNPATNIVYFLPESQQVRVGVYNVVGQQVAVLADETMRAGEHSVVWNASDMPSGIYIVQLETGNRIFTRKITLIK